MLLQSSRTPVITAQHGSNHKIKRNIKTNKRRFLHRNQVSKQRGDICRKCSERHHLKETIHGLDVQLFQTSEKGFRYFCVSFSPLIFLNTVIYLHMYKKGTNTDRLSGLTLKTHV